MRPILALAATIAALIAVACSSPDESVPATATPSPVPNPAPFTGGDSAPILEAPATPAASVSAAGTGSGTATVGPLESGVWWVDFTHTGTGTFDVTVHDGAQSEILLVSAGDYTGRRWLPGGTSYLFDVDSGAQDTWNILLRPIVPQPAAVNSLSGTGDLVSGYFTPAAAGAASWDFLYDGEIEFIVQLYCDNGRDIPVLEFGEISLSSVVRFPPGAQACFWDIRGEGGTWSFAAGEPTTVTTTPPPAVEATPGTTISDGQALLAFKIVLGAVWDTRLDDATAEFFEGVPWIANVHTYVYDLERNTIAIGADIPLATTFRTEPERWRDETWAVVSLYATGGWKSFIDEWESDGDSTITPNWLAWTPALGIGTTDRQLLVLCPGSLIYALSQGQAGQSEFDQQCTFIPE